MLVMHKALPDPSQSPMELLELLCIREDILPLIIYSMFVCLSPFSLALSVSLWSGMGEGYGGMAMSNWVRVKGRED